MVVSLKQEEDRQWVGLAGSWSSRQPTRSRGSSPATWASSPATASPSPPRPSPSTTGGRDNWMTGESGSSPPTSSHTDRCPLVVWQRNCSADRFSRKQEGLGDTSELHWLVESVFFRWIHQTFDGFRISNVRIEHFFGSYFIINWMFDTFT